MADNSGWARPRWHSLRVWAWRVVLPALLAIVSVILLQGGASATEPIRLPVDTGPYSDDGWPHSCDTTAHLAAPASGLEGRSTASSKPASHGSGPFPASSGVISAPRAPVAGTDLLRYDPDFAVGQLTRNFDATASQLADFGAAQGWKPVQSATGPLRFVDENGIFRLTIKSGSTRAPGSGFPHVEIRNAAGQRIDAFGNLVTRRSPGNHTPIIWDLP